MSKCVGSMAAMYPLFQGEEGGSTPTPTLSAKALRIERIPFERAKELNRAWHSRLPRFGTGFIKRQPFLCHGAMASSVCYAVAIWSNPQARELPQGTWFELRRMASAPGAPRNTCSRMLRIMELLIRRERPTIERLISYQDVEAHTGGIYAAAGWMKATLSDGGEWDRPSRSRPAVQSDATKQRWEKHLT